MPQITPLPTPPSTSDPTNFASEADAFLGALPTFGDELNAFAASLNTLSTNSSSTSSVSIGTGTKNFTIETGKSLFVGMSYKMANDANNWMLGDIISYNSGTGALSIDVDTVRGSGTYATWVGTLSFNGQIEGAQLSPSLVSALTAETSPATDDEVLLSDTSEGALNKITLTNLLKVVNALTNDSLPDANADYILTYDASSSDAKKVLLGRLLSSQKVTSKSASGVSVEFTGIPSWVRKITLFWSELSTNSTTDIKVQLGDSGGYETSGYSGYISRIGNTGGVNTANSTGFLITDATTAGSLHNGKIDMFPADSSNTQWVGSGEGNANSASLGTVFSGSKTLSGTLDRVQIYINGTAVFDGGIVGLILE